MKALLLAALFCGISFASEDPPKQVRVSIQYIEMAHPVMTELLGGGDKGGNALHAKAMELAKSGEAKILETAMVVCRSGHKSYALSVLEEIYPSDFYPSKQAREDPRFPPPPPLNPKVRSIVGWQTKDVGSIHDTELNVDAATQVIDLRFRPEYVQRLRLENVMEHKDQWGEASYQMPVYEKWAADTALSLRSGKSELISVINPRNQLPPPAVSRRILLFVRADILDPPSPQ